MNWWASYILWFRELKRFFRNKQRIVSTISVPFFWFTIIRAATGVYAEYGTDYFKEAVPSIICLITAFSAGRAGFYILEDVRSGQIEQILLAPVSKFYVATGKALGVMTVLMFRTSIYLLAAVLLGAGPAGASAFLQFILIMVLITVGFTGLGFIFALRVRNQVVSSAFMYLLPVLLYSLSGSLYSIDTAPGWLGLVTLLNPMAYGLDGLRMLMTGNSNFGLGVDFVVLSAFSLIMIILAAASLSIRPKEVAEKSEPDLKSEERHNLSSLSLNLPD